MSMWDDEAGYDRDDPKHPGWAGVMADAADDLRKRRRENGEPNAYVEAWKAEQRALAAEHGQCEQTRSGFRCILPAGHDGGCWLTAAPDAC